MRVNVNVTLDIDTDAWRDRFGTSGGQAVREEVKHYAELLLLDAFGSRSLLAEPTKEETLPW